MRGLLSGYAKRGGTVLLSSHLLNEVQLIADDIIMIGQGRIVAEGTPQSLISGTGTFVKAVESAQLVEALRREGIETSVVADGFRTDAEALQVGKVAAANQITLIELRPADAGLEDLFLELTADHQREDFAEGAVA
jgi:ABC-2 type transport system ATP-binding protein